jgi:hypothetical protein
MNVYKTVALAAMLVIATTGGAFAQGMAAPKDGMAAPAKPAMMAPAKDGMAMNKPMAKKKTAMKAGAMKGDAMKGDVMKGEAMTKKPDGMMAPSK